MSPSTAGVLQPNTQVSVSRRVVSIVEISTPGGADEIPFRRKLSAISLEFQRWRQIDISYSCAFVCVYGNFQGGAIVVRAGRNVAARESCGWPGFAQAGNGNEVCC